MRGRSDQVVSGSAPSTGEAQPDGHANTIRMTRSAVAVLMAAIVVLILGEWAIGRAITAANATASTGVDRSVLRFMTDHEAAPLTSVMRAITYLGSSVVLVPLIVVVALAWRHWREDWQAAQLLATAYLGAALVYGTAKRLTQRARPPDELHLMHAGGLAFPSGHATQAAAVWCTLAFLGATLAPGRGGRKFWVLGLVIVGLVGLSRLYLRVHWFTDVVAGWSAGAIWAGTVLSTYRRLPCHDRLPVQRRFSPPSASLDHDPFEQEHPS